MHAVLHKFCLNQQIQVLGYYWQHNLGKFIVALPDSLQALDQI